MKKTSLLLLLFAVTATHIFAQDETNDSTPKKGFDKTKIFGGGNFGASFGDFTQIVFSPQVGYRFSQYFAAGVGPNIQYVGIKYYDNQGNEFYKQTQGVYGANVFARLYPIRQAFIQIQPEFNWINNKLKYYNSNIPDQKFKSNAPSLLVSAAIGMGSGYLALNYDVLQNSNSPYGQNAFISVGFGF